jgi:hydroxyacylglutathione hydrolase
LKRFQFPGKSGFIIKYYVERTKTVYMELIRIDAGPIVTASYLVYNEDDSRGIIIDAPPDCLATYQKIITERKLIITDILLTHTHWDHIADVVELQKLTSAVVRVCKADEYRLLNPNEHTIFPLPFDLEPYSHSIQLVNKENIKCGKIELEVRFTPGHTEGSVVFVDHENAIVFAGDTIFNNGIGRTDLSGGDYNKLIKSIKNEILTLNDNYIIYSGHGEKTTVGDEKIDNLYVNSDYN